MALKFLANAIAGLTYRELVGFCKEVKGSGYESEKEHCIKVLDWAEKVKGVAPSLGIQEVASIGEPMPLPAPEIVVASGEQ
jgi:hypothetical protein